MRLKNIKNYINGMDKFVFIKQLLENEKFNPSQKERFLKLVTNELEKSSGNQASILSDIETIKNELNIKSNTKATQSIKAFVNTTNLPIVDNAPAEVVAVTDNKTVNKFNFSGKVLSYTTGEITRAANAVTLIVDEVIESIIKKNSQYPREAIITQLRDTIYVKLVEDSESQAAPTATPTKDDVDVDEKYVSNVLLSKDYVYLEKIIRDIDPRKTSLEDRKYFLSRVTKKEFKDSSLLEVINQQHKSLVSKKAVFNIDLQYYIVKQTEVIKGMYIKVGIPQDSFIIPPNITKIIAEFFKNEEKIKNNPPEPNPKHVADFMSLFNKRDGLKYLTHDYDKNSEFKINEFLLSAHKVFKKETYKLDIPPSLWRIVQKFAFDSEQSEWTSISDDYKKQTSVEVGWATKELRDWSRKNKLHPIRNEEYEKIINDFKRITRIESSNLNKLIDASIESVFDNELKDFKIEKIDLSKADFYSHVSSLKIAFESIFEEIKKRSDSKLKKKITIKYERSISEDGYYLRKILITHHNSFPIKELGVLLGEWQQKGNMGKIKAKLRGYCHWSVETIIDDAPTKIHILKEKQTPDYEILECKPEELPKGFTHILTFYYK